MDVAIPADYRMKIKESEMRDKYWDLSRKLSKRWSMKVIPIVIGAMGTVPKVLEWGLKNWKLEVG